MPGVSDSFPSWFAETFRAPLPLSVDFDLIKSPEVCHWATELRSELAPQAMTLPTFVEEIDPYVVTGWWGRGLSSNAFYWTERRGLHRCFFRLSFGSVYGDEEKDAAEIVDFLNGYCEWREQTATTAEASSLVHSLGNAHFTLRLRRADGSAVDIVELGQGIPHLPNGAPLPAGDWWRWLMERTAEARR